MRAILCKLFKHKPKTIPGHWVNGLTGRYWVNDYNVCSRCSEILFTEEKAVSKLRKLGGSLPNEEWMVSLDGENFNGEVYPSKEEAYAEGYNEYGHWAYYVGKKVNYVPTFKDAREYLVNWLDITQEERSDWSECWERSMPENKELVDAVDEKLKEINDLILKLHKPDFYLIDDISLITNEPES